MNDMEGLKAMGNAVVERAIKDYRWALIIIMASKSMNIPKDNKYLIQALQWKKDCERFFKSDLFNIYCEYDGETLMHLIQRKVVELIKSGKPIIIPDNCVPNARVRIPKDDLWDK